MDGNCELVLGLALCLQHSQPARQQESLCPESAGQEVHVLQLQAPAGGLKTLPSKHGCSSAEAGCPCQETEQMAFVQGTPPSSHAVSRHLWNHSKDPSHMQPTGQKTST